jgi:hypothetical protein
MSEVSTECSKAPTPHLEPPTGDRVVTVGIFEVQGLSTKRWRVTNLRFGYKYVTYGPWDEVKDLLLAQTKAWDRRLGKKGHGDAWRGTMHVCGPDEGARPTKE